MKFNSLNLKILSFKKRLQNLKKIKIHKSTRFPRFKIFFKISKNLKVIKNKMRTISKSRNIF